MHTSYNLITNTRIMGQVHISCSYSTNVKVIKRLFVFFLDVYLLLFKYCYVYGYVSIYYMYILPNTSKVTLILIKVIKYLKNF